MLRDGMWSGSPCLIVGGGPSLRNYDVRWAARDFGRHGRVLAVNRAAEFVVADLWIGMDSVYWRKEAPCDGMYRGDRVWIDTGDKRPDVDVVLPCAAPASHPNRHSAYAWGHSLAEGVGCGGNSGFAALNLADILGADPIYLLGFDLRGENGKTANWHDGYSHSKPANESVYDRFLESFRWASERVRARAVVLEVEPGDSRLDCFPKALARDVL